MSKNVSNTQLLQQLHHIRNIIVSNSLTDEQKYLLSNYLSVISEDAQSGVVDADIFNMIKYLFAGWFVTELQSGS